MSSLFAILLLALFAVGGIAYATARRTGRIGQSGRFARAGPALAALVGVLVVWLMGWLLSAGIPVGRIAQAVGLRVPGKTGGDGGRIPDLVVWSKIQDDGVWLPVADVLLVVEIISPGSEASDTVAKRTEYAGAGIPRYWIVDQDSAQTVTMYRLDGDQYRVAATMPLAWVLNTSPAEHHLG